MTIGIKIKSIKKIEKKNTKVYDIEVKDAHHYIFEDGTLSHNSYVPTKEMGSGSGLKYSASTIVYLSKKKEKDGTEIVGNLIKAKAIKSRLSRENREVELKLFYDERGLDRYYGLLELGELGGLWKNSAGRYEINGKKIYAKQILANPEEYFTEEVMKQLDDIAKQHFTYGTN